MKMIKGKNESLWSPLDVIYAACYQCGSHLGWRKYFETATLVSSCCGFVFNAEPVFQGAKFEISFKDADLTNVIFLSVIEYRHNA